MILQKQDWRKLKMTRPCRNGGGTDFSNWLRKQPEIDSKVGYNTTDIDFVWEDYKADYFMLLETKEYMAEVTFSQRKLFNRLHNALQNINGYKGYHLLQFEKTSPENGKIYLDRKEITKAELIKFLQFILRKETDDQNTNQS